ncbi:MAG: hypothetical protein HY830_24975 [Actinobacteria bacterium]|nr:hypothetical protein [Actinomycetota bacterium]
MRLRPPGRAAWARDPRRAATAVLVTGPLAWLFHDAATPATAWWVWPGAVVCAVLGAVAVAGYVAPSGSGRLLERGCTPCAVVPAVSIVGGLLLLDTTPGGGGMLTAMVLLVFGLQQRRTAAAACAVPLRVAPPDA